MIQQGQVFKLKASRFEIISQAGHPHPPVSGLWPEWPGSWDCEKPSDGLEPSTPSL
jgi:hypothetical protein